MNKRHLHHLWKTYRTIKPWYFIVAAIIFGIVGIFALRANNEQMVKLRAAVFTADQRNGNVQGSLQTLQAYVTRHMNTDLSIGPNAVYPPIQLKYTYDRLVRSESAQRSQANSSLYTNAEHYCEQQNSVDFSGHNRVPCIEQYVQSHSTLPAIAVPDALYKFAFVTPVWSPDLAGWSLVLAAVSGVLALIGLLINRIAKHLL